MAAISKNCDCLKKNYASLILYIFVKSKKITTSNITRPVIEMIQDFGSQMFTETGNLTKVYCACLGLFKMNETNTHF